MAPKILFFSFAVSLFGLYAVLPEFFLSEIADFSPIYRQIRQLFGPKSRKIRQFLAIYSGKIDPLSPKFRVLLHFYALIFSEFKILNNLEIVFYFTFMKENNYHQGVKYFTNLGLLNFVL